MLIVALVLAVVGLAALITAVITSNELIAWVCIAASVIGVLLLIVDALPSRSKPDEGEQSTAEAAEPEVIYDEDYPEEAPVAADYADANAGDSLDSAEAGSFYSDDTAVLTAEEDAHGEPAGNDGTNR